MPVRACGTWAVTCDVERRSWSPRLAQAAAPFRRWPRHPWPKIDAVLGERVTRTWAHYGTEEATGAAGRRGAGGAEPGERGGGWGASASALGGGALEGGRLKKTGPVTLRSRRSSCSAHRYSVSLSAPSPSSRRAQCRCAPARLWAARHS